MEVRGYSDARKGPWAKEYRQPLEARKDKEMDSPMKLPQGI